MYVQRKPAHVTQGWWAVVAIACLAWCSVWPLHSSPLRPSQAEFLRAYGATESLPPEDADCIVDNTATGSTLRANNLHILETITRSSTRLFASKAAMADPAKKAIIDTFVLLLQSVLDARARSLLNFNVTTAKLEEVLKGLPSMRSPTVTKLQGDEGYAISTAVLSEEVPALVPVLKAHGATDILVLPIQQLVA